MTFDFSDGQLAARDAARRFGRERVAPVAAEIDGDARVPADLAADAKALLRGAADALSFVLTIEELAIGSGAVALAAAARGSRALDLAGLRGGVAPEDSTHGVLATSAVALGVARAALDRALADLRESSARPGESDKPHWAVADAATELDAAELLTYRAAVLPAGDAQDTAAAMARLLAAAAASHSVDVALRLAGAAGFAASSPLERLARDARALTLLGGGEDALRATAAAGLLPG
jgi:alkylation response protein AidB-like acyl-CoA dehydrogenase